MMGKKKKNRKKSDEKKCEKRKEKNNVKGEESSKSKIQTKPSSKKTFTPGKPLKKNPVMTILDQHQEHRLRIAKIIASLFVIIFVVFMIILGYKNWIKVKKFNDRVAKMEKKLDVYDQTIEKSEGFKRDQEIVKAIIWTYKLEKFDWKHAKKWQNLRDGYFSQLPLGVPLISKNFVQPAIAMDMIAIPKGEFTMGRTQQEIRGCIDELPQRKVRITYPFWMARTEIANFQYRVFFPQYATKKWDGFNFNLADQPAVQINWHLASEYCNMLTYTEKKKKRLPKGYVYRLPTEAEWEYACRAGTDTYFYWGNVFEEEGAKYANCLDRNSAQHLDCSIYQESAKRDGHYITAPVGSYQPNAFGLNDMSGNVWEWCWDWYNPNAYRKLHEIDPVQIDPVVSKMTKRGNFERIHKFESTSKVIRGGGCLSPPSDCRSATRDSVIPEKKDNGIGFRIVLAPEIESLKPDKEKK